MRLHAEELRRSSSAFVSICTQWKGDLRGKRNASTKGRTTQPEGRVVCSFVMIRSNLESVREKDRFDLCHDLLFGLRTRDGDFFDDQGTRRVEHATLAEGQLLVGLEAI